MIIIIVSFLLAYAYQLFAWDDIITQLAFSDIITLPEMTVSHLAYTISNIIVHGFYLSGTLGTIALFEDGSFIVQLTGCLGSICN